MTLKNPADVLNEAKYLLHNFYLSYERFYEAVNSKGRSDVNKINEKKSNLLGKLESMKEYATDFETELNK